MSNRPDSAALAELTEAVARFDPNHDAPRPLTTVLFTIAGSTDQGLVGVAETLLTRLPPRLWLWLDRDIRQVSWNQWEWPNDPDRWPAVDTAGPLGLILLGCHHNGYLREAAVLRMAESRRPVHANVLALRAADSVPQVRERARAACQQWWADDPAGALRALGPVTFRLDRRAGGAWLVDALRALLRDSPDEVSAVGLTATDLQFRRYAYQAGLAAGRIGPDQLLTAALTDADLLVRLTCAGELIRQSTRTGDRTAVHRLRTAGTATIRADAVHTLALAGDLDTAQAALADRAVVVRATAQAAVRRAGVDPAERYRELLADPTGPAVGAIAGLGETGRPTDRDLLLTWLNHSLPASRAAAVAALHRLGLAPVDLLTPLLADPEPAVVRQARFALRDRVGEVPEESLWDLLRPGRPAHVRRGVLWLLHQHDFWTRVRADLTLLRDDDEDLAWQAWSDLVGVLHTKAATAYASPAPATRAALLELLTQTADTLGPERVRRLRWQLG
jgi:hypothetical protein